MASTTGAAASTAATAAAMAGARGTSSGAGPRRFREVALKLRRTRRLAVAILWVGVLAAAAGAAARPSADEDAIEVVASRSGFRPKSLTLRKGETARLHLKSADGEHCFAVDAFRVEKRVLPGRTTTLDLTPDQVGTFPFYCCLESGEAAAGERGRLVVTE